MTTAELNERTALSSRAIDAAERPLVGGVEDIEPFRAQSEAEAAVGLRLTG